MSIRNLATNNLKSYQDLQVNSIILEGGTPIDYYEEVEELGSIFDSALEVFTVQRTADVRYSRLNNQVTISVQVITGTTAAVPLTRYLKDVLVPIQFRPNLGTFYEMTSSIIGGVQFVSRGTITAGGLLAIFPDTFEVAIGNGLLMTNQQFSITYLI